MGLKSLRTHDFTKLIAQIIKYEQIILAYGLYHLNIVFTSIYDFIKYLMYIAKMV